MYNMDIMSVNWEKDLKAAIGMSGLIAAVEKGETPSDFFKLASDADGHVITRRLIIAIRTFGSDEVLDGCIEAFKRK